MEKQPQPPTSVRILKRNRVAASLQAGREVLYTPPSSNVEHYPHCYRWDSDFAAMVYADRNYPREAVEEIYSLFEGQRQDGFIPNQRFAPNGRKYDGERMFFINWKESSDYAQPPLEALAVFKTYNSLLRQGEDIKARVFLEDIYPKLQNNYAYFMNCRENSPNDPLIGVIHPHETGRDSDPQFDFAKFRLSRSGVDTPQWINEVNRMTDYASAVALSALNRVVGWKPENVRNYFWVNDVMKNCVYVDNLYKMADLALYLERPEDVEFYVYKADSVETAILNKMYDLEARGGKGAFYSLNRKGEFIKVDTAGNLCALLLPNLRPYQLEALLNQTLKQFNTRFPVPSIATDSPNYDPHYGERDRLWRGPTWIPLNYLIHRGLMIQANRLGVTDEHLKQNMQLAKLLAGLIAESSHELTTNGGYAEFFNPTTSEPYRLHKSLGFTMSTTDDLM